jgi:3-dehydroquinate dehydratase
MELIEAIGEREGSGEKAIFNASLNHTSIAFLDCSL